MHAYYEGRFGFGQYYVRFAPVVLCGLGRHHWLRAACIALVRTRAFDLLVLTLILANSIMLALFDPVAEHFGVLSAANVAAERAEWFFQTMFSLEVAIKVVALGILVRPSGYLRDSWNILDLVIVVVGWVPVILLAMGVGGQSSHTVAVVRFARVLRPLRALHMFPSLKKLVRAILNAASQIASVMLLCASILFVFALVGLTLFKGKLRQHCGQLDPASGQWMVPEGELEVFCSMHPERFGRACPSGLTCISTGFNPANGLQSFDNFAISCLTVFQIITLEGWSDIMFGLFDTTYEVYGVYFVLLVLFGAYFMTNLLISALSVNYMLVRQDTETENALKKRRTNSYVDELVRQQEARLASEAAMRLDMVAEVSAMEMRLMFEFETHRDNPHYAVVTEAMYREYVGRHSDDYPAWKRGFLQRRVARESKPQGSLRSLISAMSRSDSSLSTSFKDPHPSLHLMYESRARRRASSGNSTHQYHLAEANEDCRRRACSSGGRSSASGASGFDGGDEDGGDDGAGAAASLSGASTSDPKPATLRPTLRPALRPTHRKQLSFKEDQSEPAENPEKETLTETATAETGDANREQGKDLRDISLGARPGASPVRKWIYDKVVRTTWFSFVVLGLIFCNTVILALEHMEQPAAWFKMQKDSNAVFLALFTLELVLRVLGEGLFVFLRGGFNRLDAVIVVSGYLQLMHGGSSLAALRALRILRFFRLARHWRTLNDLLNSIQATIAHVSPFIFFLCIVLYMLTISGLHLLGGRLTIPIEHEVADFVWAVDASLVNASVVPNPDFDCTRLAGGFVWTLPSGEEAWHCPSRTNYDTFLWALVTTFQVITSEDWNGVMADATVQTGSYWAVAYFVVVVLFGTFIVLNFFLAILLDTFIQLHIDRQQAKRDERDARRLRAEAATEVEMTPVTETASQASSASGSPEANANPAEESVPLVASATTATAAATTVPDAAALSDATTAPAAEEGAQGPAEEGAQGAAEGAEGTALGALRNQCRNTSLQDLLERKQRKVYNLTRQEVLRLEAFQYNSVGCVPPRNRARLAVGVLIHRYWFDTVVIGVILWSCIMLTLESPVAPRLDLETLFTMNVVITSLFTVEMALKMFALGVLGHPGAFLRDGWGVLDAVIVASAILDVALHVSGATNAVKVLRALRALRPLRAVRKFEGVRIIVSSFAKALLPCLQVVALCLVFYGMFAITFTAGYMGELEACYECPLDASDGPCQRHFNAATPNCSVLESFPVPPGCTDEWVCAGPASNSSEWRWLPPAYGSVTSRLANTVPYSFDSFAQSWLTIFEVSTEEMWMDPMYMATDTRGVGLEPVRGSNDGAALLFLLFVFVLQYFVLQIFVAVLINTYLDSTDEETGVAFMSPAQQQWVEFNQRALLRRYKSHPNMIKPQSRVRELAFNLAASRQFHWFVSGVILVNTVWLMTEHYTESPAFATVFFSVDAAFGVVYLLEAVIKLVGFGPTNYFKSKTNVFDFVIVVAVVANWALRLFDIPDELDFLRAIEALRVLRVFRLFKLVPPLKTLLTTLILTLYPLLNIMGLILIVFFIYAVLGVSAFGGIRQAEGAGEFEFLGDHVNFDTFGNAFFTLFVMSTGESWNGISRELSNHSVVALPYTISFIVVTNLIMMNLFVAVILTNYTAQFERSQRPNGVKQHLDENSFRDYNAVWNELHAEYVSDLEKLLSEKRSAVARRGNVHDAHVLGITDLEANEIAADDLARESGLARAEALLAQALEEPLLLPADQFPSLLLKLKAPLGFRKRSRADGVRFTPAHVMAFVKKRPIPTTRQGMIGFHSTLRALIDINLLEGDIPEGVEGMLNHKLRSRGSAKEKLAEPKDGRESVVEIIAREQIISLIRLYIMRWRLRHLKRNGASDETIRLFIQECTVHSLQAELARKRGLDTGPSAAAAQAPRDAGSASGPSAPLERVPSLALA